jgi:hypothetical protein
MPVRKKLALIVGTAALSAGLVFPTATSALAAPQDANTAAGQATQSKNADSLRVVGEHKTASAPITTQGTAPACVVRSVNQRTHEAYIHNNCGRTMKLKVIINNGYDSSCHQLRHRQYFYYSWPWGSYARTVTC